MPKVAVGIIINKTNNKTQSQLCERKVLLCQRLKSAQYALKWEFPGGKLEENEPPKIGLIRELKEELGIDVLSASHIFQQRNTYPDGGVFDVAYYLVDEFSGEIQNKVFEQIEWVSMNRLNEFDILEGNRDVIEKLVEMYANV